MVYHSKCIGQSRHRRTTFDVPFTTNLTVQGQTVNTEHIELDTQVSDVPWKTCIDGFLLCKTLQLSNVVNVFLSLQHPLCHQLGYQSSCNSFLSLYNQTIHWFNAVHYRSKLLCGGVDNSERRRRFRIDS